MEENISILIILVVFLPFAGGLFYMEHQSKLLKQETIRTLVSQGVPALEAACAANQRD